MTVCPGMRCGWLGAGLGLVLWVSASAQEPERHDLLTAGVQEHLRSALWCLNARESDLSFTKDYGEPHWRLDLVAGLLDRPLELPRLADRLRRELRPEGGASLAGIAAEMWGASAESAAVPANRRPCVLETGSLVPALLDALNFFVEDVREASALVDEAFAGLEDADLNYAAGALLSGIFPPAEEEALRRLYVSAGVSNEVVTRLVAEERELDPEPAARAFLRVATAVRRACLPAAQERLEAALRALRHSVHGVTTWPEAPVGLSTPYGRLVVGSPGDDSYDEAALLILDPGGRDVYRGRAGSANGLRGQALAVVLDLAGDDEYRSEMLMGPASALLGVSVVHDEAGHDRHRALYAGQGVAVLGCAVLDDRGGDDRYEAGGLAQGAGAWGVGVLRDRAGDDRYEVGLCGQAFAGAGGVGLLVDGAGHDVYLAGGRETDHGRHDGRFVSLSQGAALGARPFVGGGVAVLADYAGNDVYQADIFGQGVGYWYGVGMLLDETGHDTYKVHHYGQGSGIHLSLGLLADGAGQDMYSGYILAQGSGHDFAVGMLFDRAGDDTYTGDHHVQGRAINNAVAMLVDEAGDDAYLARQPDRAQGVGNDGGERASGSIALLLDLAGRDRYTCGASDGARMLRPDYGVVYDVSHEEGP